MTCLQNSKLPLGVHVMEDNQLPWYQRKLLEFKDFERFKLSLKTFEKQFSNIYAARLTSLRDHVQQKSRIKWAGYNVYEISELSERSQDEICIAIGTLYKHQELKPSILYELSEELQLNPQPARSNYASFKDTLFLEDETLRVKLVGSHINVCDVVTGLVCAVLGRVLENGTFKVMDLCFPGHCSRAALLTTPSQKEGKILLLSGLDLASNVQSLSLNLLFEWISGMIGCKDSQREDSSIICVIIAGNSIRGSVETHNHKGYFQTKAHNEAIYKEAGMLTHRLDNFLHLIAQCCPVILMPGEFDPTCHTIPQQALHPCILPQSSRYKSLHGATNPWIGSINSCIIAGSSGQPIMDIMKVAGLANVSPLTWLERTLKWRHFAPTAPDTLPAYPYFNTDPFIMMECPDIYFVGNMEEYDTKLIQGDEGQDIRLVCVPKFSKAQMCVLVNLQDLRTWPVSFGVS